MQTSALLYNMTYLEDLAKREIQEELDDAVKKYKLPVISTRDAMYNMKHIINTAVIYNI